MAQPLEHVIDAIDFETLLACKDEQSGRAMALQLVSDLGFKDVDVVFAEHTGPGIRVRVRAYVHRPGDHYRWLHVHEEGEGE
jgi:hypothetical protein